MKIEFDAIYENGVLRPIEPLPFAESQRVHITVAQTKSIAEQIAGSIPWKGDPEVLRMIAEDPIGHDSELQ